MYWEFEHIAALLKTYSNPQHLVPLVHVGRLSRQPDVHTNMAVLAGAPHAHAMKRQLRIRADEETEPGVFTQADGSISEQEQASRECRAAGH